MRADSLLYHFENRIGILTINRQHVMNAVDCNGEKALYDDTALHLPTVESDHYIKKAESLL